MNWPIESYGFRGAITKEQVTKIREIIKRYRPNENDWWIPEIIEYFYPKYLASKGGVFFTPKVYCELLSELALLNINSQLSEEKIKVYDPACGTGALLIAFRQYKPKCQVYGQEINYKNHLISRWILTKRGIRDYGQQGGKMTYGNTLENDKTKKKFHIVLCSPPFNQYFKKEVYGTKDGNSAWIEQCLKHLKFHGVALIILPSSVLNTQSFKEKRKHLIKRGWLETVFYDFVHHGKDTGHNFDNAQLDTCVLLLRKRKSDQKEVLLINCAEKTKEEIIADYQQKKGDIVTPSELAKWKYNLTRFY
jgi:type I restriction-modification system DNA methylase subunit